MTKISSRSAITATSRTNSTSSPSSSPPVFIPLSISPTERSSVRPKVGVVSDRWTRHQIRRLCCIGVVLVAGVTVASCSSAGAHKSSTATTLSFIAPHPCGAPQFKPCPGDATSTLPYDPAPTTTTVPPTTTTTLAPITTTTAMDGELISVTGSGSSASTVTIDNDGQEAQHNDVALPYSTIYPVSGGISMEAQTADGDSASSISCSITSDGQSLASNTSTGPYAVVTCLYGD